MNENESIEKNTISEGEQISVETESIKCKGCGSNLVFDPETQMLKCSYCGSTEKFEQSSEVEEIAIEEALSSNAMWGDQALVYSCENCGAKIVAQKTETAALCPFCGTSHVIEDHDLQGIKPNAVIPFAYGREKLAEYFGSWAKRKIFAPVGFKKIVRADSAKGVYMPFFTFDSNTRSVYNGRLGYRRTRTVQTSKGTKTETYIVWRNVSGSYEHFFNDLLVNAGKHADERKISKLAPFDNSTARKYEGKYLSGFVAHHYEKSIGECWGEARTEMDARIRSAIIMKHHADEVAYLNVSTRHEDVTYKYLLVPVYVINYAFKGKSYVVYANGSTGRIVGKAPVAWWKVLIACVLGLAVIAGVCLAVYALAGA